MDHIPLWTASDPGSNGAALNINNVLPPTAKPMTNSPVGGRDIYFQNIAGSVLRTKRESE